MLKKKNLKFTIEEKSGKDEHNFALFVPEITHNDWKLVDNRVLLNIKVSNPVTRFMGFLANKEPLRDILFDDMCTSAWNLIDGKRSIYEIARAQSQNTGEEFQDDLRRLVIFIKHVSKQGWVRYKRVKKREEIKSTKFKS